MPLDVFSCKTNNCHVLIYLAWALFFVLAMKNIIINIVSKKKVNHKKLWKILKEMGIPDYFICVLRNFYVGQEAIVRTRHGTTDWFKIGKGVLQGCILSSCLFNLYAEYVIWNVRLDEINTSGRNINNLKIGSYYHSNGRKRRGMKEPLNEGERREWKSWLETQHSKN